MTIGTVLNVGKRLVVIARPIAFTVVLLQWGLLIAFTQGNPEQNRAEAVKIHPYDHDVTMPVARQFVDVNMWLGEQTALFAIKHLSWMPAWLSVLIGYSGAFGLLGLYLKWTGLFE